MIVGKIDVSKIDKDAIFIGKKGKYFDFALFENKNGPDEYGNDGFMVQNLPREQREAGKKNPIIANWRHQETRSDNSRRKMHGSERQPRDPDPIASYKNKHTPASWDADEPPDLPF